jgi:hypothetical protein
MFSASVFVLASAIADYRALAFLYLVIGAACLAFVGGSRTAFAGGVFGAIVAWQLAPQAMSTGSGWSVQLAHEGFWSVLSAGAILVPGFEIVVAAFARWRSVAEEAVGENRSDSFDASRYASTAIAEEGRTQ